MLPDLKPLVEELSATANRFSNTSNPAERNHIISLANQIKTEVEEPFDRVNSYVQVMGEMGALRLFLDWDAFANIPSGPEGISYTELASKLGADERLVRRMAWMLAIKGILKPVSLDYVAHTKFSEHFARKDSWAAHFKLWYAVSRTVFSKVMMGRLLILIVMTRETLSTAAGPISLQSMAARSRSILHMTIQPHLHLGKRTSHCGISSKGIPSRTSIRPCVCFQKLGLRMGYSLLDGKSRVSTEWYYEVNGTPPGLPRTRTWWRLTRHLWSMSAVGAARISIGCAKNAQIFQRREWCYRKGHLSSRK